MSSRLPSLSDDQPGQAPEVPACDPDPSSAATDAKLVAVMQRDTNRHGAQPSTDPAESASGTSVYYRVLSLVIAAAMAVLLAIGVRVTIAQAYVIPTGSMIGTLEIHDRVLAQRPLIDFNGINQGDIVVFDHPANLDNGVGKWTG